eukprot:maker-scaffold_5-snap-gene-14.3-mRNA-1 protein AED:0.00 eAED:0.00 QI:14/1/1/1/0.33/0.5/4/269/182
MEVKKEEIQSKTHNKDLFSVVTVTAFSSLPPAYMGNELFGVTEQLQYNLLKYDEKLDGLIISFENIKFLDEYGTTQVQSPNIYHRYSYDGTIFRPRVGLQVSATSTYIDAESLNLTYLNFVQVIVPAYQLREKFNFDEESSVWYGIEQHGEEKVLRFGDVLKVELIECLDSSTLTQFKGKLI